jgi:hypothetical protein
MELIRATTPHKKAILRVILSPVPEFLFAPGRVCPKTVGLTESSRTREPEVFARNWVAGQATRSRAQPAQLTVTELFPSLKVAPKGISLTPIQGWLEPKGGWAALGIAGGEA